MSNTTIVKAIHINNLLEFEVCPNYDGSCTCERETKASSWDTGLQVPTDNLKSPHKIFQFIAEPPEFQHEAVEGPEKWKGGFTAWAKHCAKEALQLVEAEKTQNEAKSLDKLVGIKLE